MIQFFKNSLCLVLFMLACSVQSGISQSQTYAGLDEMFFDYEVKTIDSKALSSTARNGGFFTMEIPKPGSGSWLVELHDSKLVSDDYLSQYIDDAGIHTRTANRAIATKGHVEGDLYTSVSLTFNDGFVYGYIKDKTGYNYIEPVSYYESDKKEDSYVIYNAKDVRPTAPKKCGNTEVHDKREKIKNHKDNDQRSVVDECYELDWAIANDFLMFQSLGSVAAVENHAIGVANNVQTNYDDEFTDEIQLVIVQQFTATTAASDPWTGSTSAGALLNSFRSWGPAGFAAVHDVGSLWTDRDFDGPTIGIAYVGVVCTNSRYNCLQDFTNNAETKRVMVSHEIGHNFSAGHDSSTGFIMSPTVNVTNTWSSNSVSSIESHIASRWCLADCAGGGAAPVADFNVTVLEDCTVGEVVFLDNSTGSDLEYEWSFPGGVPSTSTLASPSVQYPDAGTYGATLTVTNGGGTDALVQNNLFTINPSPIVNYSFVTNGTVVSFFNFTQNGDTYFWDFGDGFTSLESDPVHDYLEDGVYVVQLTATNICGDITKEEVIVIANPPVADFSADVVEGCAPLTVQFTSNASNNTDDFVWTFEGGIPETSSEENPVVEFENAGEWDVTLTVINETGDDVLLNTEYINVIGVPTSEFDYVIDGNEVAFENTSIYGEDFIWTFGDGESSTEETPTHIYTEDGTYTVVLTSENECGSVSSSSEITISLAPIPSFSISGAAEGCAPLTVNYENTSSNSPDSYSWTFEGGSPASSEEADPEVTYDAPGTYDVVLTVTNANGSNTETFTDYITINDGPTAGFDFAENGLEVTFTDQSIDGASYAWDFGDGNTSTEDSPVYTYANEGVYTVILEVTNDCGTSTESVTINNYTPVSALFSSDVTSGCADLQVDFTDQSSSNVTTWAWTFEGGTPATSSLQNPTVTYAEAGQYDVILVVSHPESNETITLENYVAVSDVPVTSFEYFDDLFEVSFSNTTVEGNTYSWDFGDGNMSGMENPTHTYDAEGVYEVILAATNECGTMTYSETVTINALPTAAFNADNAMGCGPLTVDYNNASSSNAESFEWTFDGGTPASSTEENPTVTYDSPGTYGVSLTVTSPAGSDVSTIEDFVVVLAEPEAEIAANTSGNVVTAINTGSGAESIMWNVGGEIFDTDVLEYTFDANGTYTIEMTTENECGTSTTSVDITIDVFPVVNFSNLPITACVGETITLVDNSSNSESKVWTLPNGNPDSSTDDSPEVVYNSTGSYDITLEVTNAFGTSTETFADAILVIDEPTASFTSNQTDNVVDFTSTSTGGVEYNWDFGDGTTSDDENPSHTYTVSGTYEVILTVINQCGETQSTESFTIVISSVTEADFANMKVFPNPASNLLNISLENDKADLVKINLIDVQGRVVLNDQFSAVNHTIDITNLSDGTYMLRLSTDEATFLKKVVILK